VNRAAQGPLANSGRRPHPTQPSASASIPYFEGTGLGKYERANFTDNPARTYGFDVAALQPIADRVGPTKEELVGAG
jgi:hypothetical protein